MLNPDNASDTSLDSDDFDADEEWPLLERQNADGTWSRVHVGDEL